ncbi:AraC family transcriptional regulator [Actinomycetes bacterium KLBMP 9759]
MSTVAAGGMLRDDVLLEWYRYAPGPPVVLPAHSHEEYQLNVNLDAAGGVEYRGGYHAVPPGRLTVIMPGERHRPRDPVAREGSARHLTLYVRPSLLEQAAGEVAKRPALPAFGDLVVADEAAASDFVVTHTALRTAVTDLEREVRLVGWLTRLVQRHAELPVAGRTPPVAHAAVRTAVDYLHAHRDGNVPLADLSAVSGLSPFHLTRQFRRAVGVPPHTYQLQLRIERAKRLLLDGHQVSATAAEVGFFDLSHFTRHFKRHVGVSPGSYRDGKNVHPR